MIAFKKKLRSDLYLQTVLTTERYNLDDYCMRLQVRGPRGVVVPLPGQTDPTYVAPDVLERLERCLLEEADGCCHWLREFLESDELTPPVATATQECFSMRPPHFSGDRGVPTDMIILKAQICLDLGSYLFFKVSLCQQSKLHVLTNC